MEVETVAQDSGKGWTRSSGAGQGRSRPGDPRFSRMTAPTEPATSDDGGTTSWPWREIGYRRGAVEKGKETGRRDLVLTGDEALAGAAG